MMQTYANEGFEVTQAHSTRIWRPVAVWMVVTAGAVAGVATVPGAWQTARTASTYDRVHDLLVAGCTAGLALALAWLWVITTLTVAGLVTGRPGPRGGATRHLVLLACGAAIVAGTGVPAAATGGDGRDLLVGLTLPERAVAPAPAPAQSQSQSQTQTQATAQSVIRETYVVCPGDSLWSIARDHPGLTDSVDQRWLAIWLANRDVVGDDPDLILPGQALRLPAARTTADPATPDPTAQAPNSDGDR